MDLQAAEPKSPLGLDSGDWQDVTIWALATYGFLQFLALNGKSTLQTLARKAEHGHLRHEFDSTYLVDQPEEKSISTWIQSLAEKFKTMQQEQTSKQSSNLKIKKEGKKKKKTLINGKLRHVVEMAYWLVKFVGDYEKLASKSYKKEVDLPVRLPKEDPLKESTLISGPTRSIIAFSRYFLKYLGSFEKLFYAANPTL